MKKFLIFVLLVVIFVMLASVALVVSKYLSRKDVKCKEFQGTMHTVEIRNSEMEPASIVTKRCDKLTIINRDDVLRKIAFGQHDNHVAYDGVVEKELTKGQQLTITLNRVGDFLFHDHDQEEVQGTFLVTK